MAAADSSSTHRRRVRIVSPALADANNGNWQTASRWQRFLMAQADVDVAASADPGGTAFDRADVLIALHARRSAAAVQRFRAAHPGRPIAVVLTGTDLYRDIDTDRAAQHALECASQLVVLQPDGLRRLPAALRPKTRVIVQSARRLLLPHAVRPGDTNSTTFVAIGHLRDEKDPSTLMRAARLLPPGAGLRIVHIGGALDAALGREAERTQRACTAYRWLGALSHADARRHLAQADALVHPSRIEGGANVVIEALRSRVPVLASRIGGNLGLLGDDYAGCFDEGDAPGLAALLMRYAGDAAFARQLAEECAAREPLYRPPVERAAVRALLADMRADLLADSRADAWTAPMANPD